MALVATPMAYTRGGQTCSKYELHIKIQVTKSRNKKT